MATQGSSDSSGVTIRFSKHAAMFVLHDGSRMRMSQRAMQQSRLLQEVRKEFDENISEEGFQATVPQRLAVAWLQYVLCRDRRRMLEGMLENNERAIVDLLVGADMLIDDQSTMQVCAALGYLLLPHDGVKRIAAPPSSPDFSDLSSSYHWLGGWNDILNDSDMYEDPASIEGTSPMQSSALDASDAHRSADSEHCTDHSQGESDFDLSCICSGPSGGRLITEGGSMGAAANCRIDTSTDAHMCMSSEFEQFELEDCSGRNEAHWSKRGCGPSARAVADEAPQGGMSRTGSHNCVLGTTGGRSGVSLADVPADETVLKSEGKLRGRYRRQVKARSWEYVPEPPTASSDTESSELSGTRRSWGHIEGTRHVQMVFERQLPIPNLSHVPVPGSMQGLHRSTSSAPGFLKSMGIATWVPAGLSADDSLRALKLVRAQILEAISEDLGIATIRASTASLAGLLCCLPPRFHPLALRAHAPSIDARRALRIQRVDSATALLAVSATSSLPRPLQSLRFHARGISQRRLADTLTEIGKLTALTSLDISGICMGSSGVVFLAPHLCQLASLRTLSLGENDIGAEGAQALAPCFAFLPELQTLELAWNDIGEGGARAMTPHMSALSRLQVLGMNGNQIGAGGAAAQAAMLPSLRNLRTLSLYYNAIGNTGAIALSLHLTALTTLRTLDLEGNGIGDEGAIALAPCMTGLGGLEILSFVHNRLGDDALEKLSRTLTALTSLKTLDLASNCIGDSGIAHLAPCIPLMHSLQLLSLNFNRIGDAGAAALAENLRHTTVVQSLLLRWNALGDEGLRSLQQSDSISRRLGPYLSGL